MSINLVKYFASKMIRNIGAIKICTLLAGAVWNLQFPSKEIKIILREVTTIRADGDVRLARLAIEIV